MNTVLTAIVGTIVFALFIWLIRPAKSVKLADDEILDPNDSRAIGMLVGMFGGSIEDAAVARFALQRFEEAKGRKASVRDAAMVVGLMQGMDSLE